MEFQWAGFNHPDTRCVTSAAVAANVMTNRARLWFVQSSLVRHHGGATWQTLWKRTCPYAAFTCSSDGLIPPPSWEVIPRTLVCSRTSRRNAGATWLPRRCFTVYRSERFKQDMDSCFQYFNVTEGQRKPFSDYIIYDIDKSLLQSTQCLLSSVIFSASFDVNSATRVPKFPHFLLLWKSIHVNFPSRKDAFSLNSVSTWTVRTVSRSPKDPNGFEITWFTPHNMRWSSCNHLRQDAFSLAATVKTLDLSRV